MMEELFKEDFINTLVDHYGYSQDDAEGLWLENRYKYLNRIYDAMSHEISEILG